MEITFYAYDGDMGETDSEDCNRFRAYAKSKLREEYPDAKIIIKNEMHTSEIETDAEPWVTDEIVDFANRLWEQWNNEEM